MQLHVVIVNKLTYSEAVVNLKPVHVTRCFVQVSQKTWCISRSKSYTIKQCNALRIKALSNNCIHHFLPIFSRITRTSSESFRISRFYQKEI
jgi:hypothetical protein